MEECRQQRAAVHVSVLAGIHKSITAMQAAKAAQQQCAAMHISVFSDRDIATQQDKIEAALAEADIFFGSLLFDYDQVTFAVKLMFT